MGNEWPESSLADLCDSIDYGYTASASLEPTGPRFLRITDIVPGLIDCGNVPFCNVSDGDSVKFALRDGDIVLARTGATTGASAYAKDPPESVFASYLVRLRVKLDVCSRFVAYWLKSEEFWTYIRGVLGDKSAQPNASARTMTQARLRVPPLTEQRGIARILGTLDDKIELNRRMNETLQAMARAIFKSWFVDFNPVRAKAAGRKPPGLDAATAALFPAAFQDSPIGPIPKGWAVVPLPRAFEMNPTRSLRKGAVAPYVDMGNMPTASPRPLGWIDRDFTSGMKFANGDVLVARITPCLENGKTAYVDFLDDGQVGWGSTEYIVLRGKPPLPPEYAYFLARSEEFRQHAIANMTGSSGRQRVPVSCFDGFLVPIPPEPIARRFGQIASPMMQTIKAKDGESRTLAAIRDALLPKLMNGKLRVACGVPIGKGDDS